MGDENSALTPAHALTLLRRTGFGARPADVARLLTPTPKTRGQAVDDILNFTPTNFKPTGRDFSRVHNRWFKYMLRTVNPLQEKLVLFWHDHFATSNDKVEDVRLMALQNQLLRRNCKGNFKVFVKAINKDPAMMNFLDTIRNHRDEPNENYGRELQELFTLGVKDFAGNPTYSQHDVHTIARAFSGWSYDYRSAVAVFDLNDHNLVSDGDGQEQPAPKLIYGHEQFGSPIVDYGTYGGFPSDQNQDYAAGGEGAQEIDAVIDIIFQHKDTDGKNTVARFIARKLLNYFCYTPDSVNIAADALDGVADAVIAQSSFDTAFELQPLLRAIFVNDVFYETGGAPPYTVSTPKSVKWPIDFVVSTLRMLDVRPKSVYQYLNADQGQNVSTQLSDMGQLLFAPPSVFGWDWETAWLSSTTLLARYEFAREVVAARYGAGRTRFRPDRLIDLSLTNPGQIVDAVTDVLGVTNQLTSAERDALIAYLGGPFAVLNLNDFATQNVKLRGLFSLVLESPAYQLH